MIFGAVIMFGLSAAGIFNLTKRQLADGKEHRTSLARENREKTILESINDAK